MQVAFGQLPRKIARLRTGLLLRDTGSLTATGNQRSPMVQLKFCCDSQIGEDRELVDIFPRFVIVAVSVIEQILSVICI